jgi:hypothetical protein
VTSSTSASALAASHVACPACGVELRLTESVPSALAGAFVYVRCPSAACAKDLVASIASDAAAMRLLTPEAAHLEEQTRAGTRQRLEVRRFAFPMAVVIGGGACAGGCAACAEGPGVFVYTVAGSLLFFLLLLGIARLGLRIDARLGAKRWILGLPRAELGIAAPPQGYRG